MLIREEDFVNDLADWPSERRQSVRVPLDAQAAVNTGDAWLAGRLLNLSLGGALFEAKRPSYLFRGPSVLRLAPPSADTPLLLPVSVVRITRTRFALRWERSVRVDEITRLRRLANM
jgi:hypothetical protein